MVKPVVKIQWKNQSGEVQGKSGPGNCGAGDRGRNCEKLEFVCFCRDVRLEKKLSYLEFRYMKYSRLSFFCICPTFYLVNRQLF